LLLKYQEQYLYFLVDEYQDTNGAQNKILEKLIDYWQSPNVFAVGDDDQAIYRFQGANMENILSFVQKYNPEVVILNHNFRSSQLIIDASSSLIDNNEQRLSKQLNINKNIAAAGANALLSDKVNIRAYPNPANEEASIFWEIHKLRNEGFPLNKIAVIYRNHNQVANLTKVLEGENFPVNIRKKLDILTEPFIVNIIEMLQLIYFEQKETGLREDLLFKTLIAPVFNIQYVDTIKISRETSYNRETKEKKYWLEVISDKEKMLSLGIREVDRIYGIFEMITRWINLAPTITVQDLFEKVITESGILNEALSAPDSHWKIQLLTSLFDFIKSEGVRNPFMKLADFIGSIEKMKQGGISLPLVKVISTSGGVNFITAHSAKGLEFQKVFLMGANKENWESKRSPNIGFSYPPNILLINHENKEEDERRVFYVAATRAEQELNISYAESKDDGSLIECSRFVTELANATHAIIHKTEMVEDNSLIRYKGQILQEIVLPPHEWIDKELIDKLLENYEMSVTDLNKYLRCPLTFYYENIIKVPSARTAGAGFGSAIHYALEQFFKESKSKENKEFGTAQMLVDFFKTGMLIYRSHFTEKEFENLLYHGTDILKKYHADQLPSWFKPDDYKMEQYISNVHFKNIPIKGMIDKIESFKDSVHVIDYKTGKPAYAKKLVLPPKKEDDPGGDYWRQLIFYKILLDNDPKTRLTTHEGSVFFIEPEDDGTFYKHKIIFNPAEMKIVENQLIEVYNKIKNHEFSTGCGESNCAWCNFVRHRTSLLQFNKEEESSESQLL
jgi:DNA helicase II / ATP-dependent DNA helicase PcrA